MNRVMIDRLNDLRQQITAISSELRLRAEELGPTQKQKLYDAGDKLDAAWQDVLDATRMEE